MERENNLKEYRTETDELPKHGAGSEYGRDLKVRRVGHRLNGMKSADHIDRW